MKKLNTWNFRSIVGKIIMGIVLVSMIGSFDVLPAFGKNNKKDNRRYEQNRGHNNNHGRPAYRPYGNYGHRERVYYPHPPVIWLPPPPPGIGIFFPPFFIHH